MSTQPTPQRRSFFRSLNSRLAGLTAVALGTAAATQAKKAKPAPRWEPARHEKDDWLEKPQAKHRLVFDTTSGKGFGEGLAFAGNYIRVNGVDYGLQDSDLSVLIVARHHATAFAYNDAMWAKYGEPLAAQAVFEDPKTKQAPVINVYNAAGYGGLLPSRGSTIDSVTKRGLQFAVCATATRAFAGAIARKVGGNADTINSELIANLVTNARMVPAGIVAVSRAQERSYTVVTA